MSRGVGIAEWLAGAPESVVFVAAVLTQFADLWFLTLTLVTLYWLGPDTPVVGDAVDRDRMLILVGLLVLYFALTVFLKELFALPRPPWFDEPVGFDGAASLLTPVAEWLADADGYGFPSGHAIAATIGWGGLAWAVRIGRQRTRVAVASAVVVAVSLTRLVIGVHYLADVVVGVLVGLVVLGLAVRTREPLVPFALATLFGAASVAMAGLTTDTAGALGLGVGAALGWGIADHTSIPVADSTAASWATAIGLVGLGPVLAVAAVGAVAPVATLAITIGGGVGIVVLPVLMGVLEERIAR